MSRDIEQQDFGWDSFMEIKYLSDVQDIIEQLKNQEYQLIRIQHILTNAKQNKQNVYVYGKCSKVAKQFVHDLNYRCNVRAILVDNYLLKVFFNKSDVLIMMSDESADKVVSDAIDYVNKGNGLTIGLCGLHSNAIISKCNTSITVQSESESIVKIMHYLIEQLIVDVLQRKA